MAVPRQSTKPVTIPPIKQMSFFIVNRFLLQDAVHCPPAKNGVMYAMRNPREFSTAQVMIILFSHALDSSTVRPDLEKFISSSAMLAVTMAAMVETPRICV